MLIRLTRILFLGISLSFGLLSISAQAQTIAIKFSEIPKGTQVHYLNSEGRTWVEQYRGKRGKFYVVDSQYTGNRGGRIRTSYYDVSGNLVKHAYHEGQGYMAVFKPFSCDTIVGDCLYTRQRLLANYEEYDSYKIRSRITKSGSGYKQSLKRATVGGSFSITFKLGKYNLKIEYLDKSGDEVYWERISAIK